MVKIFLLWILLLCASWSNIAVADVKLSIKADKKITVLGEPLLVELKAVNASEALSSINLDKLKQNFNVYGVSSSTQTQTKKGRSVSIASMMLTLYPLRSGKLRLPALNYKGKSTFPLMVTVIESSKQTSRVIIKTALDIERPQVRQANTLTLDIYDDGSLQWSPPREIVAATAHLRTLAASQREETVEGIRYTIHRYAWALMPLREGGMTVEFPMLDAMKLGTRLRYPVAPLWLSAAAVPAYLPVHLPIGKIQLALESLPLELALDRPVNRRFSVQGSGLSIEGLGKLLTGLRSNDDFHFYPPLINIAENERPTSAMQTLQVTLPFVPMRTGALKLPEIILPYYDPATLRVESVFIPATTVEVFNPLWQTVLKISLVFLLLISIVLLAYALLMQLKEKIKRKKSLLAIGSALNYDELQQALLKFNAPALATPNLTLQQWLQHMQSIYVLDNRLSVVVHQLECVLYGAPEMNVVISELSLTANGVLKKLSTRNKQSISRKIALIINSMLTKLPRLFTRAS